MYVTVPALMFHQYGSDHPDDRLLMFAAKAGDIWSWAGVPRKGWRVRMLYQRWISDARKQEVTAFWDEVSKERDDQARRYLVGPNAITAAIFDEPKFDEGMLTLSYERPFSDDDSPEEKLMACATVVLDRMVPRLTSEEQEILNDHEQWIDENLEHNYVLESMCQIKHASDDAEEFITTNKINESELDQLISSLEALCRPALIVDGQHRLYGAAYSSNTNIWLPVVAIPNSPWMEQIYQFVVINEKAKKVESSLLTDIFGSSLTPSEQQTIRSQLNIAGATVDPRIAAVIAARDPASPFFNLVKLQLDGDPPGGTPGFIPDSTVRQLIEGGRGARGWRSDDEFFEVYVKPTFPDRAVWDSWSEGLWREYWFAFWATVKDWYNEQAGKDQLWTNKQTNLTKAVTLRLYQKLFMEEAIDRVNGVLASRETLIEILGADTAEEKIAEKIAEVAIPGNVDDFVASVQSWFLTDGVPVRVFQYAWVSSLDDAAGQEALYQELVDAFRFSKDPSKKYRARNAKVFTTSDR